MKDPRNAGPKDPISLYICELKAHLRARGLRRRRIVLEVEAHLDQSSSEMRKRGLDADEAMIAAIERFGAAEQVAAQFKRPPAASRLLERRLIVLWVSWIAAMGMGSATVWAAVSGPEAHAARSSIASQHIGGAIAHGAAAGAAAHTRTCSACGGLVRRCALPSPKESVRRASARTAARESSRSRRTACP
jgi:hypothetical protein